MRGDYWRRVLDGGAEVPPERRLDDLTQELFEMLGDPDPDLRDSLAYTVLATWISEGVYDDLLTGLADGAAAGLRFRLGAEGDDSVFRRSFSALVLSEAVSRDNVAGAAGRDQVLKWGDLATGWYTRERDLRGFVPGKGWAHTVAHGADLLAQLARSAYFGLAELTVLLDVVGDRLLMPTEHRFAHGEDDRLAHAVMTILHRNVVPQTVLDPWVARLAAPLRDRGSGEWPTPWAGNTAAFLKALHLQLGVGVRGQDTPGDERLFAAPPNVRADLILTLLDALRSTAPWLYR